MTDIDVTQWTPILKAAVLDKKGSLDHAIKVKMRKDMLI